MKYGDIEIITEGYPKEMWVWDNNIQKKRKGLVLQEIKHTTFPYRTLFKDGSLQPFRYAEDIEENIEKPEFVLPESWLIEITEDNIDQVNEWKQKVNPGSVILELHEFCDESGSWIWDGWTPVCDQRERTVITFEQFKKYVMKEKEIIGYKLKDDCVIYKKAIYDIAGLTNFDAFEYYKTLAKSYPKEYDKCVDRLIEAQVFDLWFEPVHKHQYSLPKINGHDGECNKTYNTVEYGCAKFNIGHLCGLYNNLDISDSRSIKSITLSSDVTITIDEIKQILDYVDNQ